MLDGGGRSPVAGAQSLVEGGDVCVQEPALDHDSMGEPPRCAQASCQDPLETARKQADEAARRDLERALTDDLEESRRAAALALRSCPHAAAAAILERNPVEFDEHTSWADLAPRSTP